MATEAVCDTGPILHLWEIGRTSAQNIFDRLLLPPLVSDELSRYGAELGAQAQGATVEVVSVGHEERRKVLGELGGLGIHGPDAEVVVLVRRTAFRLPVLTDDLALRRCLEAEGADVSGSFGVLVRAYAKKFLSRSELEGAVEALFSESTLHAGRPFRTYARALLGELP